MDTVALEWANVVLDMGMEPDWVLGHAPFAEIPAYALAQALRRRGGLSTQAAYSRLVSRSRDVSRPSAPGGDYVTTFPLQPGDDILLIADDVVTGASTVKTGKDAESKGGVILPIVPCLANLSLSDTLTFGPDRELPLLAASTFTPRRYRTRAERSSGERVRCELCVGSVALAPREGDNWAELQRWMARAREM